MARGESVAVDIRKSIGGDLPSSSTTTAECPWNERFQALLELDDSQAKFAALSNVGSENKLKFKFKFKYFDIDLFCKMTLHLLLLCLAASSLKNCLCPTNERLRVCITKSLFCLVSVLCYLLFVWFVRSNPSL
jgi:hypothetical protein